MQYGMISYVVPFSAFPDTYNGQPLMYIALASQKQYMSLYLTSVYADESVSDWFRQRYLATGKKLNMGKSCVRFRKLEDLPLDLVAEDRRPDASRQIRRRGQGLKIWLGVVDILGRPEGCLTTKGRGEHLFVRGGRGGTRRTPFLSTKGHEGLR